jgi:hypothetical protein
MLGLEPNQGVLECQMENPLYQYDKELNERMKDPFALPRNNNASLNSTMSPPLKPLSKMTKQFSVGFGKKFTIRERKFTMRRKMTSEKFSPSLISQHSASSSEEKLSDERGSPT